MAADRKPYRREAEDKRRQALIEATLALVSEGGARAATVRAIATRAGVTAGLIRHYFQTKEALIVAAYGKGPDRSYIGGCSNGGRHTMVAMSRFADQYDGFLAGAPGLNQTTSTSSTSRPRTVLSKDPGTAVMAS